MLLEVYAAGEQAIAGADGKSLCQGIRQRGGMVPVFARDTGEALTILGDYLEPDDVVIVQGAGNVNQISEQLIAGGRD
jgi:UDP-N-acetylmuramate--alanine ligase